jgi:hypothetical protein
MPCLTWTTLSLDLAYLVLHFLDVEIDGFLVDEADWMLSYLFLYVVLSLLKQVSIVRYLPPPSQEGVIVLLLICRSIDSAHYHTVL